MRTRLAHPTKALFGGLAILGLIVGAWAWNLSRRTPLNRRVAASCTQARILLRPKALRLDRAVSARLIHDPDTISFVDLLEWGVSPNDVPPALSPRFQALYAYVDGVKSGHQPSDAVRLKAVAAIGPIEHWGRSCTADRRAGQ
jgi:hypothetical protein